MHDIYEVLRILLNSNEEIQPVLVVSGTVLLVVFFSFVLFGVCLLADLSEAFYYIICLSSLLPAYSVPQRRQVDMYSYSAVQECTSTAVSPALGAAVLHLSINIAHFVLCTRYSSTMNIMHTTLVRSILVLYQKRTRKRRARITFHHPVFSLVPLFQPFFGTHTTAEHWSIQHSTEGGKASPGNNK